MIVRPRPGPFGLLFILRGSVVPAIAPKLLTVVAVSAAVAVAHHLAPRHFAELTPAPFTLLGLALSIFLGFRNNSCYERWWEGRRQWGQLASEARILAREAVTLLPEGPGAGDEAVRRRFVRRIPAFAHALRVQLRGGGDDAARVWLPAGEWARAAAARSRPDAIMLEQAADLGRLLRAGALSDMLYRALSDRLAVMTDVQTACERLRATPTPFTYSLLLHRTAWLFCLLLPFGLVGTVGAATPVIAGILAYAFFGLDALGEELEAPFARSPNALPLDAMARGIEIAALQALGEADLPPPLAPVDHVLL